MESRAHATVRIPVFVLVLLAAGLLFAARGASAATQNLAIYADALASGWVDYSWKTTRNPASTTPVHSGANALAVTITGAWGALYLHTEKPVSTAGYDYLRFWVHGGSSGGQRLQLVANGNTARDTFEFVVAANTWTEFVVPLPALGNPATLADLYWQDATGAAQATFHLDDIALVRLPTADHYVYADSLAPGWFDYSWKSTRKADATSPSRGGPNSLAVTITGAWGALYLHTDSPIDTTGFDRLRFWVHGGAGGGQQLQLVANEDSRNTFDFSVPANVWTEVVVPLAALGNPGAVSDLYWQDALGAAQATFYLDDIALLVDGTRLAAECFFAWAERTYPALFPPGGGQPAVSGVYRYRYYPGTANHLGVSSADKHVWVLGPLSRNLLLDVAPLDEFLATAGCPRY